MKNGRLELIPTISSTSKLLGGLPAATRAACLLGLTLALGSAASSAAHEVRTHLHAIDISESAFAVSPVGTKVLITTSGEATVWDFMSGNKLRTLDLQSGAYPIGFLPDGHAAWLTTGTIEGHDWLLIWDTASGSSQVIYEGPEESLKGSVVVRGVSDDGSQLLVQVRNVFQDRVSVFVGLMDACTGQITRTFAEGITGVR